MMVARFQIATGAPQPLALVSTTSVADSELELERTSVGTGVDGLVTSTTLNDDDLVSGTSNAPLEISADISKKDLNDDLVDNLNSSDVAEDRSVEENSDELVISSENKDFTSVSTMKSSSGFVTAAVTISSSTESEDTTGIFTEISSEKNKDASEISISRYVPPLDPMKHMLMMEAKKKLQLSTTLKNPEATTIFTPTLTTEAPLVEIELTTGVNNTFVKEPEIVKKSEVFTENNNIPGDADPTDSSVTSIFSSTDTPEQSTTKAPATPEISEITTQDSIETVPDINHESSILIKSSELFSGKEQEIPNAVLTTDSSESTSTDMPSETPAPSTSTMLEISSTTMSTELSTTDNLKATEKTESEDVTQIPSLERSEDEINTTETSISEEEASSTIGNSGLLIEKESSQSSESSTSETKLTTLSALLTTISQPEALPESENMEKLLSSHSETNKNVPVGEDLELRESLEILNASDVLPNGPENEEKNSMEIEKEINSEKMITESEEEINSEKIITESAEETATVSILTTLKELLFPSTAIPMLSETSEEALQPDSTSVDSSPEIVKVELLKSDIDSISSSAIDSSTTVVPELDSETKLPTSDQTTTTQNSYEDLSCTENSQASSESIESTSSEASIEEDTLLNSELINSSEPESIPAFHFKDSFKNETVIDKSQFFSDMNTKDRYISGNNTDMVAAVQFLHYHDKASSEQCFKLVNAHWNYATDLTDVNKKKQVSYFNHTTFITLEMCY